MGVEKNLENIDRLSPVQKGILFHALKEKDTSTYFEQFTFSLQGAIQVEVLEKSIHHLIEQHEGLRTVFLHENLKEPVQVILKKRTTKLIYRDFSQYEKQEQQKKIDDWKRKDRKKGFDLTKEAIRFSLLRLGEREYQLIFSFHHILLDGWSVGLLLQDLFRIYHQIRNHQQPCLRRSPSYRRYIRWLENQDQKEARAYWKNYLQGLEQATMIPTYQDKGSSKTEWQFHLENELTQQILRLAQKNQVTFQNVIQTIWGILLQKYLRTNDVLIGAVVSGRTIDVPGIDEIIGLLIHTLPVRVQASKKTSFMELAKRLQADSLQTRRYQYLSLAEIQVESGINGALFDHLVSFESFPIDEEKLIDHELGIKLTHIEAFEQTHYPLTLHIAWDDELVMKFRFQPTRFSLAFVQNMAKHFQRIVHQVVNNPQILIDEIELITEEERERLLHQLNQTTTTYPTEMPIHQLVEQQVEKNPEQTAVVDQRERWSYQQLNQQANQLAHLLRRKGLKREQVVGILVDQRPEMLVGILAVLKAGGAYLPIDVRYPMERIRYMLTNSQAPFLLIAPGFDVPAGYTGEVIRLQASEWANEPMENLAVMNKANDLAYVIYTSGSTGKPKGVMVEHRSLVNLAIWHQRYYQITSNDQATKLAGFGFDASVWEIFPYLITGATLHLIPEAIRYQPEALNQYFEEQGITISFLPTPLAEEFMELENHSLRYLLVGGDRLRRVPSTSYQVVNNYGPTENTVVTTCAKVDPEAEVIPIGRPIANNQVYVLSPTDQLQPIGVPGELCISGEGLARGYLHQEELTKEKFGPNPVVPGERMYRTGDLVRWLPTGELEYIGRMDDQVKIRGYRIELGEIESQLRQHPEVKEAIVRKREDQHGNASLCAYVVGKGDVDQVALRKYLQQQLPDYMIPSYWVMLQKLPITPNGKVDLKALPKPIQRLPLTKMAPRNRIEEKLYEIWKEVLSCSTFGIHDSFFECGGHSLKAIMLISRIHQQFQVKLSLQDLFTYPTIDEMAAYIERIEKQSYYRIEPAKKREYYPITSAQKRLYAIEGFENTGSSYHMPILLRIKGEIKPDRLRIAFQQLAERHEILRTSFHLVNEQVMQKVHSQIDLDFQVVASVEQKHVDSFIMSYIQQPFHLEKAPLFRIRLIQVQTDESLLWIDFHHLIADGVSMNLFLQELAQLYQQNDLPSVRLQYKDYAVWQQNFRQTPQYQEQEAYWKQQFADSLPVLELPTDYPRPAVQHFNGDLYTFQLEKDLVDRCKQFAYQQHVTLYTLYLAVYNVLLMKYTQQNDIIVGLPTAGRPHLDLENVMGLFVNTLPIRNFPTTKKRFVDFLEEVKKQVFNALEHADYPLEELVKQIDLKRDLSRNPLFQTVFVFQNMEFSLPDLTDGSVKMVNLPWKAAKFDLTWTIVEDEVNDTLSFSIEYCTDLFRLSTIQQMANHFIWLLEQIVEQPAIELGALELVTPAEKEQLLHQFNQTQAVYPKKTTIHQLVEQQVEKNPEQTAVVDQRERWSYQQLNQQANQLAHLLRRKGLKREQVVGILVDQRPEMLVGILAVLKAGGAYLPIDVRYPMERIRYMLTNSQAPFLLIAPGFDVPAGYTGEVIRLQASEWANEPMENLAVMNKANDLAYVIYTSGSTGKPKGVMVEHRSLVNLAIWHQRYYQITSNDQATKLAGFGFDASVWEIFPYLITGATLHLIPEAIRYQPEALNQYFEEQGITISFLPTPLAEEFMELENHSLRYLLVGGDRLRRVPSTSYQVVNNYGPTENTVVTTCAKVDPEAEVIPIGRPIANNQVYVLSPTDQLQPIGVPGELCISGEGLARGYLHQEELTKEKFGPNPVVPGERMYRTGDLVRWLPTGELEYIGRMDDQVKIRGYRIELGEIESQLRQHPEVKEAIVRKREDQHGNASLCAYVVGKGDVDQVALRKYLQQQLPDYMIPSYWVMLQKLPITPNGKVDEQKLAKMKAFPIIECKVVPPRTENEKMLAEIWQEILQRETIGIDDSFFVLGGDSIKAIRMIARLQQRQMKLQMKDLYQAPTIRELAPRLIKAEEAVAKRKETVEGEVPLTPIQQWAFQLSTDIHHWNMGHMLYKEEGWDLQALTQAAQALIVHHDALRMTYQFTENDVKQFNRGLSTDEEFFTIDQFDLTNEQDVRQRISEEADRLHQRIRLDQGPLVRFGLFKTKKGDHLLMVIHHLVVDAVSLRILVEDLETAYQQALQKKQSITLPPKTDSFQIWSQKLQQYANSWSLLAEIPYWQKIEELGFEPLPTDYKGSSTYLIGESEMVVTTLAKEKTQALRTEVHHAYQTEINDILLAALVLTVHRWAGLQRIGVMLEGHGRQEILEEVNIARTVGWFTTMHPVIFAIESNQYERVIQSVQQTLRQVPHKGIGYGILKYLTSAEKKKELSFQLNPEISFNYMGHVETYSLDSMPIGFAVSPTTKMTAKMDVNGSVTTEGLLLLSIRYNPTLYRHQTMEWFLQQYKQTLCEIVDHCRDKKTIKS